MTPHEGERAEEKIGVHFALKRLISLPRCDGGFGLPRYCITSPCAHAASVSLGSSSPVSEQVLKEKVLKIFAEKADSNLEIKKARSCFKKPLAVG